jgi:uncharacterized protein (TIGR04255 family)
MTPSVSENSRDRLGPAHPRHLGHAPITEAVIDFRVQLEEGFAVQKFEPVARQLEQDYPTRGVIRTVLAKLDVAGAIVKPDLEHGELGVLVKSLDEKTQAQFRLNGFTLNRLEPYTSWARIYPETIRLWRLYVETAKPIAVVRLAARYINRLKLPLPVTDLRDYLLAPPRIPENLPQTLRAYLTRLVIHDSSLEQSAIVTQSFEPNPTDTEHAAILLDIDAFKDVVLKATDQAEIDRIFGNLRAFKNDIFFGSITQRASELFE